MKKLIEFEDLEGAEEWLKRTFNITLAIVMIIAALYFFGGNFAQGTPEPEFWLTFEKWIFTQFF